MWLVALPAELITRRLYRAVWFYMPCYVGSGGKPCVLRIDFL